MTSASHESSTGTSATTEQSVIHAAFTRFVGSARWFGGKGRDFQVTSLQHLGWLGAATERTGPRVEPGPAAEPVEIPRARVELAVIEYADGDSQGASQRDSDVYQVPVAYYREAQERLEHALIGQWVDPDLGEVFAYDALHDRYATNLWLQAFQDARTDDRLSFRRIAGHDLDLDVHSTLFSGEQSNSSVAFGEDSLMKVFRKVTPGRNPDIEIHEMLTEYDSEHVAMLYGYLEASPAADAPVEEQPTQLAMLQQFLRTASDGWGLGLASVRDLFAEADLHADEVGGDFAGESHRLGVATAQVHAALRDHFPSHTWGPPEVSELAEAMKQRLADAVAVVPDLEPHAERLRETYEAVSAVTDQVVVQRVHGDLHLGQTLRTVRGWKIVDFEGEPAKPLAERVRPDSALRDVAGMLRSFDYAAHAVEVDVEEDTEQIAYRALEWAERNRGSFLDGYLEGSGRAEPVFTDTEQILLTAYEADKAVYETVYEARNRPTWVGIPLAAIERLTAPEVEAPTDPKEQQT